MRLRDLLKAQVTHWLGADKSRDPVPSPGPLTTTSNCYLGILKGNFLQGLPAPNTARVLC